MLRTIWVRRAVIAVAIVLMVVVSYLGAGSWAVSSVVRGKMLTLDRVPPPPTSDPYEIGFAGDPQAAFGYAFSDVSVPTPLGPAPAWLVPGTKESTTWAIFVHGRGGQRQDGYRHLSVYHAAGLSTLLVTYRNDAGAPADPSGQYGFGLTEWRDLEAAVQFARSRGATNIILDGESLGGAIVGQFLAQSPARSGIAAVVLDAPALDAPTIAENGIARIGFPLAGAVAAGGLWWASVRGPIKINKANSVPAVARFPAPLFLAHGDGDTVVPVEISDRVVRSRHEATTYLRTRSVHSSSWKDHPDLYRRQLNGFLAGALPGTPVGVNPS